MKRVTIAGLQETIKELREYNQRASDMCAKLYEEKEELLKGNDCVSIVVFKYVLNSLKTAEHQMMRYKELLDYEKKINIELRDKLHVALSVE